MDLIRFPLYEFQFKIYSSPEYIEKFGIPKSVSDLSKHTIIAFGHDVEPSIPDVNCILDLIPKSKKPKTIYISNICLLYTSPSPRDPKISRMPSSA